MTSSNQSGPSRGQLADTNYKQPLSNNGTVENGDSFGASFNKAETKVEFNELDEKQDEIEFKVVEKPEDNFFWGMTQLRTFFFFLSIIALVGFVVIFVFVLPCPDDCCHGVESTWDVTFFTKAGSNGIVRFIDVNKDNINDIVFGVSAQDDTDNNLLNNDTYCESLGYDNAPCVGGLIAVNGKDGYTIWQAALAFKPKDVFCDNIDVDDDNSMDCIAAGDTEITAISSKSGSTVWTIGQDNETNHVLTTPVFVGDLTDDGHHDFIIIKSTSSSDDSDPPRLYLISGKDGKVVGTMDLIDMSEIMTSPVILSIRDELFYIIIPAGSTDSDASLWRVSSIDLKVLVDVSGRKKREADTSIRPTKIFDSDSVIMAAPIVTDMNNDGVNDIVITSYNGNVTAINGIDFEVMWSSEFSGVSSENVPAPGYFNEDNYKDLMIRHCSTSLCSVLCVNGESGVPLWQLDTMVTYVEASALSLKTANNVTDMFLYWTAWMTSLNDSATNDDDDVSHESNPPEGTTTPVTAWNTTVHETTRTPTTRTPTTIGTTESSCSLDNISYSITLLMMDRNLVEEPVVLYEFYPVEVHYNITDEDIDVNDLSQTIDCDLLKIGPTNTGIVGDIDGNGDLDFVFTANKIHMYYNTDEELLGSQFIMHLHKFDLAQAMASDIHVTIEANISSSLNYEPYISPTMESVTFLSAANQCWTGYRGSDGSGQC